MAALLPDPMSWGVAPKPFRGLVVGAVQSGKTASMIGLSAIALDQGYRIVVVLSGNKDDLRRQTARRFNTQLLRRSELIPRASGARTLPQQPDEAHAFSLPYHQDAHLFAGFHLALQGALQRGEPAIIVVKKHTASLSNLRTKIEIALQRHGVGALPILVLDDECDDASVDREGMPIPTAIANLWRRSGDHPLVAYVGYTATSAANLLQKRDNELFPENFVYLLRFPASESSSLSFAEPAPDNWYTGGDAFLSDFGNEPGPAENFMIVPAVTSGDLSGPVASNRSLADAVRAYVVGGAYRLAAMQQWSLVDPKNTPRAHSMLVQTSPAQADHKAWFDAILGQFWGVPGRLGHEARWSPENVMQAVLDDEAPWRRWFDEFARTRSRVLEERPRVFADRMVTWDQVKIAIPKFVELLRLKIVNSDDEVGADLDFAPRVNADGSFTRPQDLFVIVIGGAVLSRGLTIEGLCVTYFTRWNPSPTEDTVLQLSRWYGYRGPNLEFCRLFTNAEIFDQLYEMNENDRDLRNELAGLMRLKKSPSDAALVIRTNPKALPTAKIGEGRVYDLSFSPFTTVFRHVETVDVTMQANNELLARDLVSRVMAQSPEQVTAASGSLRGIVSRAWTALDVADLLDGIEFVNHNPSAVANPARDYYRRPDANRRIVSNRRLTDDPYQIAAYLRQWAAEGSPPEFNVAVAYGERFDDTAPFEFPLVNREITAKGECVGGWTGPRPGWKGDQAFDISAAGGPAPGVRPASASGLVLLYVVHKHATGRHGRGLVRSHHTPVIGIVIPTGGPTWRRVAVDRRKLVAE